MLLPKFEFHEPATIEEACELLSRHGPQARPLAGGTDLLVAMKRGTAAPRHVVCLGRIERLRGLALEDGLVRVGACCTAAELADSAAVEKHATALRQGALALGGPQVRNRATIGGNLATASPAADLAPALIAYHATVVLQSSRGTRRLAVGDFLLAPGVTAAGAGELLVEVLLPCVPAHAGCSYQNLGARKAHDRNFAAVASYLALDGPGGAIHEARIVLGSVGERPTRSPAAEKVLAGGLPGGELFACAGAAAARDATPRRSPEYRRAMVGVLTRRTLAEAWLGARESDNVGRGRG